MITNVTRNVLSSSFEAQVTNVRLNGNVVIDDFVTREVDQDTVTIEFNVPIEVNQITKLEIIGTSGVLSESNLFVPVDIDTRFKYTLRVV